MTVVSRHENLTFMKSLKSITAVVLLATSLAVPTLVGAADAKTAKPKPYTLKKCMVSGEDLQETATMKPYVFTYEGREIKLCCEGCLKDFKKDTAKYIKKIEAAEKKAKK